MPMSRVRMAPCDTGAECSLSCECHRCFQKFNILAFDFVLYMHRGFCACAY